MGLLSSFLVLNPHLQLAGFTAAPFCNAIYPLKASLFRGSCSQRLNLKMHTHKKVLDERSIIWGPKIHNFSLR